MDVLEFLETNDVRYWESGKNVSSGWVNIQCPFCNDTSNHCGINLSNLKVSCWICGGHDFIGIVTKFSNCSRQEAREVKKQISIGTDLTAYRCKPEMVKEYTKKTKLPVEATRHFPSKHIEYLRKRGFKPPKSFIKKYDLQAVYTIGKYRFRVIIPVYMNRKLCAFTSRSIIPGQKLQYLSSNQTEATTNIKHTIYNYDNLHYGSDAILVEGPLDVWKLGDNTISTLGVKYTNKQIILIKEKKINTLFIFFDRDEAGVKAARELSEIMAPLVKNVEILTVKGANDPGELSLDRASILKYQLGFRKNN